MDMPTQDYGTSGELSFQDGSLAGAPESSPGADPHHQDAQQQATQQQQIPSYSSIFVREMQQQVWWHQNCLWHHVPFQTSSQHRAALPAAYSASSLAMAASIAGQCPAGQ